MSSAQLVGLLQIRNNQDYIKDVFSISYGFIKTQLYYTIICQPFRKHLNYAKKISRGMGIINCSNGVRDYY